MKNQDVLFHARYGNLAKLKSVLKKNPLVFTTAQDEQGSTPLALAIMFNHSDLAVEIVNVICDPTVLQAYTKNAQIFERTTVLDAIKDRLAALAANSQ